VIVTYFRSSSYNTWGLCQQQYLLTYVLGLQAPSGRKAEMGTILHKVMECLANCKLCIQNGTTSFEDDALGTVPVTPDTLTDPRFVEKVLDKAYAHYSSPAKSIHKYTAADKRDIRQWCWDALQFQDGAFDPRKRTIVATEPFFDLPINEPWAHYSYVLPDGKELTGQLRVKGTVDLITKLSDTHYEVIDWKGLPLDTPIPTPSGWTTMRDVRVGDIVFGGDGSQCSVVGKSTAKQKQCYTLTFDDKSTATCDEDHLWRLADGRVVNVRDLKFGDKIPVAGPLQIDDVELPISPYALGEWLRGRNVFGVSRQLNIPNHKKHIPTIYLRSSHTQRLSLLRGLMSIKSHSEPNCFATTNEQLARDMVELLLSLGKIPRYSKTSDDYHIRLDESEDTRVITSVEKGVIQPTQCIMVDSPDNTYLCTQHMIPTHNTGECKDWSTSMAKDYADFCKDPQLRIYHWALSQMYPEAKTFGMTINYVRTAGPFTVAYSDDDIRATMDMLRKRFEQIKATVRPKLKSPTNQHWFCKRVCWYGKTMHPKDGTKTICQYIAEKTRRCGLNTVMLEETDPSHTVGYYHNPGS